MGLDLERTLNDRGVTIVLRNTTRNALRYEAIEKAWPAKEGALDEDMRTYFAYLAGFIERADGLESLPLKYDASGKQIEQAYQRFLDETDEALVLTCVGVLNDLRVPPTDAVERRAGALAAEETADPN